MSPSQRFNLEMNSGPRDMGSAIPLPLAEFRRSSCYRLRSGKKGNPTIFVYLGASSSHLTRTYPERERERERGILVSRLFSGWLINFSRLAAAVFHPRQ